MKTKRSFRLQKLKFLMCTLRKSHFCGAPASRMKYSRVNLEYHHILQCIGCAAECWASSQLFWSCWIVKRAYIPGNGNCLHHRQCGIIKSSTLVWNFGHCVIFPGWLCKNEIFDPTIIILEYLKYLRYLKYLLVHLIILVLKSRQGTDSHADNGDRHKRGRDHWHTMSGHADEGEYIPAVKYFFFVSSNKYLADLPIRTTFI